MIYNTDFVKHLKYFYTINKYICVLQIRVCVCVCACMRTCGGTHVCLCMYVCTYVCKFI